MRFLQDMMQAYADAKADPTILDAAAASQNVGWSDTIRTGVAQELSTGALDPSLAITPEGMQANITFYETNSGLTPGLTVDQVANFDPLTQAGGAPSGSPAPAESSAPSGSEAPAATVDQAYIDDVCAKGVAEAAVNIWIDIDPDLFEAEIAPFKAAYPAIQVTQSSVRPTDSVPKVITDITAGQAPETDIVQGEAPLLDPLVQRGLIDTSYRLDQVGPALRPGPQRPASPLPRLARPWLQHPDGPGGRTTQHLGRAGRSPSGPARSSSTRAATPSRTWPWPGARTSSSTTSHA